MDMLSKLPEAILCHILSFLPTKTSVACSVLSKRWKLLWTCVPVLDLALYRDMPKRNRPIPTQEKKEEESRFLQIVDKVYLIPRDLPVKILRLHIPSIESLEIVTYLHELIKTCLLQELDLSVSYIHFKFRKSVHYCSNIEVLKLNRTALGQVKSCLFPKLRILHFLLVDFKNDLDRTLENFLSACPVLEELVLVGRLIFYSRRLRISVPTLTSLVLHCTDSYDRLSYKFVLQTPALEYLSFQNDVTTDSLVASSLCNLRKADITCLVPVDSTSYGTFLMRLLRTLSGVEFLKLSFEKKWRDPDPCFMPWSGLADKFAGKIDHHCLNQLPVFYNLVRLELCIPYCDYVLLPRLLQSFPNLKHITIHKIFDFKEAELRWNEPRRWKEPQHVPICLSSTLSSFCFREFEGFEFEVEMVKYVTRHAKVLKSMKLIRNPYFKSFEARAEATHELPMVLRGSEACQFHII